MGNLKEFEKCILQFGVDKISLLFIVESKDQIAELYRSFNDILLKYSQDFDLFCYLKKKSQNDSFDFLMNTFPAVAIYNGNKKVMELSIDFDDNTLESLLIKIHNNIEKLIISENASDVKGKPKALDKIQLVDDLFKNQELTGMNSFGYIY